MIKAVIFDMDGTLIDSNELVLSIYRELLKKYPSGVSFDSLDIGDVLAKSYAEVLQILYGIVQEKHLEFIKEKHSALKKSLLKTFSNAKEMLIHLKSKGYRLGLLTSEGKDIALDELKLLGLHDEFDSIYTYDDLSKPKPSGQGLMLMMKKHGLKTHEVIYVGDQISDALAAKDAHVYSVWMGWNVEQRTKYEPYFDDSVFDFQELIKKIEKESSLEILWDTLVPFRVLQLTDLHLMDDEKDELTFHLIKKMIERTNPGLIVFTGDQTMSNQGIVSYQRLGKIMDSFGIPFSYIFGNHDTEGGSYQRLNQAIESSQQLMFQHGPIELGYSNYAIRLVDKNHKVKHLCIFMDTHIDAMYDVNGKSTWGYGTISIKQIEWYKNLIHRYEHISSSLYMHIPLPEVKEIKQGDTSYVGDYYETPSVSPVNYGFFEVIKELKSTKIICYGHDHLNDFMFEKDGIKLAYGRVSGHYDYAMPGFPKGARLIEIHTDGTVKTEVLIDPLSLELYKKNSHY